MKKKTENKNSLNIRYVIISIMVVYLIIISYFFMKYYINNRFYCEVGIFPSVCGDYEETYNMLKFLLTLSVIIYFIIIYKIKLNKKSKIIVLVASILILASSQTAFYFISDKQLENSIVDSGDIKKAEIYYKDKGRKEDLYNIYEEKITKSIKDKNIETAIKYLNSYEELNPKEKKIMEYKYKIACLAINDLEYYKEAVEYFESLENYKDSENKKKELVYKHATNVSVTNENYNDLINELKSIKDYKDSVDKIKEIKYEYAKKVLSNDEKKAMEIFEEIDDYKDSKDQYNSIKNKHQLDGKWSGPERLGALITSTYVWIINGDKCYNIYNESTAKNVSKQYKCAVKDNKLEIYTSYSDDSVMYSFEINGNILKGKYKKYSGTEYTIELKKVSESTELPDRTTIKKPAIGMTHEEVKASTWGSPNKINKSTYSWGTTEQWVYSGNRYIYFKNGKVTSISESE